MQRKDYYSTIKNLFCSWITVDIQCLLKLHLQSFYFLQDNHTQPRRHMHVKSYTGSLNYRFPLGFSDIPDIWDHWMGSYTTTLIQEIHSAAERVPPCSFPPCSTLLSRSLAFTWYVKTGNISRRKLTCLSHPLPPNHSPNVTHTQLWRWSPSPRQAAGRGWRRANWPFLELMWICFGLQWAWKCYARVCF